ncbi:MAG: ROK family protein [Actinobacteria bacterium]|nr:MAG: ROK family protein [Actinomycetota bacterium]
MSNSTIGIDIGGTHLRVGVVDAAGEILDGERVATPASLSEIVAATAELARKVSRDREDVRAAGAGAAGMIDANGVIRYAPNLTAFIDAPLQALLADALGYPVRLDNDANVAAIAEVTYGAARGQSNALVITLGTGIGGGIVADGNVVRGAHGFAAEVGHFQIDPNGPLCACGQRGHWEALASGRALGQLARERAAAGDAPNLVARVGGDHAAITGVVVGESARAGEADGLALLHEYAARVAIGLAGLVNILDPSIVVISGGLVELGELLLEPVRAEFGSRIEGADHRPAVPVVAAALGDNAGVVGAAVLARELLA